MEEHTDHQGCCARITVIFYSNTEGDDTVGGGLSFCLTGGRLRVQVPGAMFLHGVCMFSSCVCVCVCGVVIDWLTVEGGACSHPMTAGIGSCPLTPEIE